MIIQFIKQAQQKRASVIILESAKFMLDKHPKGSKEYEDLVEAIKIYTLSILNDEVLFI